MRAVLAGVAVVVGLVADARPAVACSHPCLPGTARMIEPEADAVGVPLNAELKLRVDGYTAGQTGFELVAVNQGPATFTVTQTDYSGQMFSTYVLHPDAPLLPNTTYQIRDQSTPPASIGHFTTGTTTLVDPPPAPPASDALLSVGSVRACGRQDLPACCQTAAVIDLSFYAPTAVDSSLTFTIRDTGGVIIDGLTNAGPLGMVDCEQQAYDCGYGQSRPYAWKIGPGTHTLSIVAVDLAGHESTPVERTVTLTCASLPPDAGLPADADSGSGSDGDACSCRAGRGRHPRGAAALLVALALVVHAARRAPAARRRA
jgi:hypothetical protein